MGIDGKKNKGFFFTLDALMGLSLLVIGLILASSLYMNERQTAPLEYFAQDLTNIFSTIKISEINNSYVDKLISNGSISDAENTVLEQIGEFWALNKTELARELAKNISAELIPDKYGFSVLSRSHITREYDVIYTRDKVVYDGGEEGAASLVASKKMISGIEKGEPIRGTTSQAYLKTIEKKRTSSYIYFGGFVGQGNITAFIDDIPADAEITYMYMELDAGDDFKLYVNNDYCNNFNPIQGNMTANGWNIAQCIDLVIPGEKNNFTIRFNQNLINVSYIGGGYIKTTYNTAEMYYNKTTGKVRYWLPGIEGLINLYSSAYVPGYLNSVDIYLHFFNNYTTLLAIGNTTIFNSSGSAAPQIINIKGTTLPLPPETIPLRMWVENITKVTSVMSGEASDSILVTDVSGSMGWCAEYGATTLCKYDCCAWWGFFGWVCAGSKQCPYPGTCSDAECGECTGWFNVERNHRTEQGTTCLKTRLEVAQEADNIFVDTVLNYSGTRIGLVSYSNNVITGDVVSLTDNKETLKSTINDYEPLSGTCICCGIYKAADMLTGTNKKFIVLMSDGDANYKCSGPGDYTGTYDEANAPQSAINAGQYACNRNITVYTIGFGNLSLSGTSTLKDIACNESLYYDASNVSNLTSIYKDIGQKIITSTNYSSQIISVTGNLTPSILYPDSYIEFNYTPISEPATYGEIELTMQSDKFANCTANISLYSDVRLIDVKVTSYSSEHWTSLVKVNDDVVYNLSRYGSDYRPLGDPFIVQIPVNYLTTGNNEITILTADDPYNFTGCSKNNSLIYTGAIKSTVSYTAVLPRAEGCNWQIEFEDGTFANIDVPSDYTGSKQCNFTSEGVGYDRNDTVDVAVYDLLGQLDFDDDNTSNVNLNEINLKIEVFSVSKIPYMWGPTIVEARVWE